MTVPLLLWWAGARRFGRWPTWECIRMVPLLSPGARWKLLFQLSITLYILVKLTRKLLERGSFLPIEYGFFFAVSLSMAMLLVMPPTVLLLASSGPHSKSMLADLKLALFPGRVVALLRTGTESFQRNLIDVDYSTEELIAEDNFRTSGSDWNAVVRHLSEVAPILVLDTRVNNPAVAWEVIHVLNTGLWEKTVFVAGAADGYPALEAAGDEYHRRRDRLTVVTPGELIPYVKGLLRSPDQRPAPAAHTRPRKPRAQGGSLPYHILDQLSEPGATLGGLHFISPMLPSEQVQLLLHGIQHHEDPRVRANCIVSLEAYKLDEGELQCIVDALQDRSAVVRQAAAGFIGVRGSRGKPIRTALPALLQALSQEMHPSNGGFEEEVACMRLPGVLSSALQTTVGARVLRIDPRGLEDLQKLKRSLESLAADPEDPVHQEDARKYLKSLFSPEADGFRHYRPAEREKLR
jgi:hypothetical protein